MSVGIETHRPSLDLFFAQHCRPLEQVHAAILDKDILEMTEFGQAQPAAFKISRNHRHPLEQPSRRDAPERRGVRKPKMPGQKGKARRITKLEIVPFSIKLTEQAQKLHLELALTLEEQGELGAKTIGI